ncbi:DUF6221 family protein [Nocardia sp. NPDC057440]|uniref:DUF6221 family protein n=1 Tax=Nocardia sp. NPDC057440 TaxID=3346134 RepID=UPI00366B4306
MTIDAALAALTAGLAEDERLALAAIGGTEASRWVATLDEVYAVTGPLTGPHRCDQHAPGVPNDCDDDAVATIGDVRDDAATIEARAAHIAAQSPHATLLQVEAIRKVLAVCDAIDDDALNGAWWEGRYGDHADDIREALAGIYTEPTEES